MTPEELEELRKEAESLINGIAPLDVIEVSDFDGIRAGGTSSAWVIPDTTNPSVTPCGDLNDSTCINFSNTCFGWYWIDTCYTANKTGTSSCTQAAKVCHPPTDPAGEPVCTGSEKTTECNAGAECKDSTILCSQHPYPDICVGNMTAPTCGLDVALCNVKVKEILDYFEVDVAEEDISREEVIAYRKRFLEIFAEPAVEVDTSRDASSVNDDILLNSFLLNPSSFLTQQDIIMKQRKARNAALKKEELSLSLQNIGFPMARQGSCFQNPSGCVYPQGTCK